MVTSNTLLSQNPVFGDPLLPKLCPASAAGLEFKPSGGTSGGIGLRCIGFRVSGGTSGGMGVGVYWYIMTITMILRLKLEAYNCMANC